MAALATSTLALSACRCGCDSVDLGVFGRLSGRGIRWARLGESDGEVRALFSRVHWAEGSGSSRRRRVAAVRSQVGTANDSTSATNKRAGDSAHSVVIVGAGIAGLSAAVALHSVGAKVLVLEQSSSLRASGASLFLWKNAWRALDYLGVADELRKDSNLITTVQLCSRSGKKLKVFELATIPGGPHEARGVVRRVLIESLAAKLPAGAIRVDSQVCAVDWDSSKRMAKATLKDGSEIFAKVLVGCDGVNSVVGKWMGLGPIRYVGQMAVRGVADYPQGHDLGVTVTQYLGEGTRFGVHPISPSKVYWFLCFCSGNPGPKVTDPKLIKAHCLEILRQGWPNILEELVVNSPDDTISRVTLGDRWNIPGLTSPVVKDGITLGGDALHPMTPNLGQGGCTAIEDGIILARELAGPLAEQGSDDPDGIHKALQAYAADRQKRVFPVTVKAFIAGFLLSIGLPPVVFVRNNIALPMFGGERFLSHTMYDVGRPTAASKVALK